MFFFFKMYGRTFWIVYYKIKLLKVGFEMVYSNQILIFYFLITDV